GLDHAVLLVKSAGGDWVMLDMQSDRVVPAASNYGYKPVISFAGGDSFLHGRRYQPPQQPQQPQ
ncbi:MAG: transglutaminase, partial [Pseudomonas stutzeri]|nr:transglutaminase [Stutzerimonas stutzeri]